MPTIDVITYIRGIINPDFRIKTYCTKGKYEQCKKLLDNDVTDINYKDSSGNSLLHLAIEGGNKDLAEYLIDKGAYVDSRNEEGKTPLHYAASKGKNELIEMLIDKGADVNAKDNSGDTVLDLASTGKATYLLIDKGAKVIEPIDEGTASTIHKAAARGVTKKVVALVKKYPELLESVDSEGQTPFYKASLYGEHETALALIKLGAKCDIKDNKDIGPLEVAGDNNEFSYVEYIFFSFSSDEYDQCKTIINLINYGAQLTPQNLDTFIHKKLIGGKTLLESLIDNEKKEIKKIPSGEKLLAMKLIQRSMEESLDRVHNFVAHKINQSFNFEEQLANFCLSAQKHIDSKETYLIDIDIMRKIHEYFPHNPQLTKCMEHVNKCAATTVIKFFSQKEFTVYDAQSVVGQGTAEQNIGEYLELESLASLLKASTQNEVEQNQYFSFKSLLLTPLNLLKSWMPSADIHQVDNDPKQDDTSLEQTGNVYDKGEISS
ncbi:ankyrin repeat domain-containing protein [Candidatus Phycorickettsia trachydisci]|nr:ankyrin repeat domain-containing protein [Candidatus Phycorickettsia trachydisci]